MKMADADIDPFGNHNKSDTQPDEPKSETILLTPGGVGGGMIGRGATWEPEREMSFAGTSIREKVLREHTEGLYQKPSEITHQTPEAFHFDNFELRDGKLYYGNKSAPLTKEGGS